MKFVKTRARVLLCSAILIAFFIPAYNNISGLGFISTAFSEAESYAEITPTDIWLAIIPLLLVPVSALIILACALTQRSITKTYLAVPFLFIVFFFGIIFFSARGGSSPFSSLAVFFQMQPGFYIAAFSAFILIFTKTYRKKRRRRSSPSSPSTEAVATA